MKTLLRVLALVIISFGLFSCVPPIKPETGVAGDGQLDLIVDYIRETNGLPALAAIMVHDDEIIEKSAMGKRIKYLMIESNFPVTVDDQWHIGSCTKSMTSLVAALQVKKGIISWDRTIAEVYPELVGVMRSEYEDVRLDELLSHTSGLPRDANDYNSYYTDQRDISVQRRELVEQVLVLPPTTTRGVFEYSNAGYIVAAAMLEEVTGNNWETLMEDQLFEPLSMTQSGFGAPDTQGSLAQPVGHYWVGYNLRQQPVWFPLDPSFYDKKKSDNPPVLGPAGTVHVSLDDMAAYLGLHLKGLRGESVDGFLDSQEFEKLYTPFPNSIYALGWRLFEQFIVHTGSNALWSATMCVNAEKNIALFMVTNAADNDNMVDNAINDLVAELLTRAEAAFE